MKRCEDLKSATMVSLNTGSEFNPFGKDPYPSPIDDLRSSELVSYTISGRPVLSMATTIPDKAFKKISDDTNLSLHSDQGWQYQQAQDQGKTKGLPPAIYRQQALSAA